MERINLLGRLARLSALGISMGMGPKRAVAHALEAENLKNYAAALGYTPGDVANFLELGLTIEQTKDRMARGKRPEIDLRSLLNASHEDLCFHPEVDRGWSFDAANPYATVFWVKCRNPQCGAAESSPFVNPELITPRKLES